MPHRGVEQRKRAARISMVAWYCQILIGAALSCASIFLGPPWAEVLLIYLTLLSVWTGIESAHARLNADLPTDEG